MDHSFDYTVGRNATKTRRCSRIKFLTYIRDSRTSYTTFTSHGDTRESLLFQASFFHPLTSFTLREMNTTRCVKGTQRDNVNITNEIKLSLKGFIKPRHEIKQMVAPTFEQQVIKGQIKSRFRVRDRKDLKPLVRAAIAVDRG